MIDMAEYKYQRSFLDKNKRSATWKKLSDKCGDRGSVRASSKRGTIEAAGFYNGLRAKLIIRLGLTNEARYLA